MIDHVTMQVADVGASRVFYEQVLAPLGIRPGFEDGGVVGFAEGDSFPFWLVPAERNEDRELHIAFLAASRDHVNGFHEAAVKAGAEILHEPRIFEEYHPAYFGCFVRDPDGHNIEAVCHTPSG